MLLINQNITDPYFNIAAEEYLLKNKDEDIFILYINSPSIIVGKHQNTLAEINYRYSIENKIPVIRRISGGGTVYHDSGNLNFTIITSGQPGQLIDFNQSTLPVKKTLQKLGIEAKNEGKNNLCVNGLKISGNAAHVYKNRIMHHGTLLVSADLKCLSQALNITPGKYIDNGVKSIRSNIVNLENVNQLSIELLKQGIIEEITEINHIEKYDFNHADENAINRLVQEKYCTWEWNYGYSPVYEFFNKKNDPWIYLKVEKGIIADAHSEITEGFSKKLIGKKHEYQEMNEIIKEMNDSADDSIELIWQFF